MSDVEARLKALGIEIPSPAKPAANYVPVTVAGGFAYVAGQLPMSAGALQVKGHLGGDVDVATGQTAARLCAINIIAQLKAHGLDLDRLRAVKLVGFAAAVPEFTEVPFVINGASDLMVAAFGENGKHARSAVCVAALPFGAAVEVEAIFEIL